MAKALRIGATEKYVLRSDRELPESEQTKFLIGELDGLDFLAVRISASITQPTEHIGFLTTAEACRRKLLGWENLQNDEDGSEVKFPGMGNAALRLLDPSFIVEIGDRILNISRLEGEDVGKSESPSDSQQEQMGSSALPAQPDGPEQPDAGDAEPPPLDPPSDDAAPSA